jgi:glyoxylase-like metal-dependent hydrolase (beta-lactamase superfamily II)
MASPVVHRFQASLFPVNAYLLELPDGIVVIDSTLGVSDGRALRARVDATGKSLRAVIVTHTHPDHYGGLTALVEQREDRPIVSVQGVRDAIQRDDPAKEAILRPMFGDEWPQRRTFPSRTIRDGERLTFGTAALRVIDLGPGESPHDSLWLVESNGAAQAFVGDLVYNHMHGFLADGFHREWLANIARARRELPPHVTFYPGHGESGPASDLLDWQEGYIRAFMGAVRSTIGEQTLTDEAAAATVTATMKAYLGSDDLLFLMQLSIAPIRAALKEERDSVGR